MTEENTTSKFECAQRDEKVFAKVAFLIFKFHVYITCISYTYVEIKHEKNSTREEESESILL